MQSADQVNDGQAAGEALFLSWNSKCLDLIEREWLVSVVLALEPNFVHTARQLEDTHISNAEMAPSSDQALEDVSDTWR